LRKSLFITACEGAEKGIWFLKTLKRRRLYSTAIEYDTHKAYAEYYNLHMAVDYSLQILSFSLKKECKSSSVCWAT